jgi:AbiV family abortive infection protein
VVDLSESKNPQLTREVLREYAVAALDNANALREEAELLLKHRHLARAYFLAVASIEETGKALLAFDGQGRNLSDPAIVTKLTRSMETHRTKINAAFFAWIMASPNIRDAVMPAINLIIALSHGREPSMYTDIRSDTGEVQQPSNVVREVAATDSVRLAVQCFEHARRHVENNVPTARTLAEDQLFAMKTAHYQEILNTEDFWWYHISRMEAGEGEFASSVVTYRQEYVLKNRQFRAVRNDA